MPYHVITSENTKRKKSQFKINTPNTNTRNNLLKLNTPHH